MSTPFLDEYREVVQRLQISSKLQYVIAVSGGIDSVVLCEACYKVGIPFSIAHCNFGLRGDESRRDEMFVRSLGDRYRVQVHVQHFSTTEYAAERGLSIQEAARVLRYNWFEQIRKETGATAVLLAHHANDNIETLLMHFFRGTGLHGLAGMPEHSSYMAVCKRPLLHFTREQIVHFAKEQGLPWVEDSSNSSNKYTRNYFRNELLPALQKVYPQVEANLLANIDRAKKTALLYDELVTGLKKKLYDVKGDEVRIPVKKLMQYRATSFIYEVIKDFYFTEKAVPEVEKLAQSGSGKYIENGQYRLIRHRNWFVFAPKKGQLNSLMLIEKDTKRLLLDTTQMNMEIKDREHFTLSKDAMTAQMDLKELAFPLIVRRWKEGDYFYPLGMHKKKKLSRFFIDQKLSINEKENIWVVESRKRICWIVGYRLDDRFKIQPHTTQIFQISLSTLSSAYNIAHPL